MTTTEQIYDWCITNNVYLEDYITNELKHLEITERLFENSPELFQDILNKAKLYKLRELLVQHLNITPEEILVTIDEEFVILVFDNIRKAKEQYAKQN